MLSKSLLSTTSCVIRTFFFFFFFFLTLGSEIIINYSVQASVGEKPQSVSDDELLALQTTANLLFTLLCCGLDLFPLCTVSAHCYSPPPFLGREVGGYLGGQARKETRGNYFEVPPSPSPKISGQFYGL